MMESFCVTLVMFFVITSISANQLTYQPYGPGMCRALTTRFDRITRYHLHNLNCAVTDEKVDSANRTCREVINARKGQVVCIPATSPELPSPRLFLKSDGHYITSFDILSGNQIDNITLPESEPFMSCPKEDQKLYFYSKQNSVFSFDPHTRKVETIATPQRGRRIEGMAIDGVRQILYASSNTGVLTLKIGRDSDFHKFSSGRNIWGIATSSRRSEVFGYFASSVIIFDPVMGQKNFAHIKSDPTDIVYDDENDVLYISGKNDVKKYQRNDGKVSHVMTFRTRLFDIDLYQDIVFGNVNNDTVSAMNMTSKTEIWSRRLPHLEDLCVL